MNKIITVIAVDMDSSNTMSRSIPINHLRTELELFEKDIPYRKYDFICTDDTSELTLGQLDTLENFEIVL